MVVGSGQSTEMDEEKEGSVQQRLRATLALNRSRVIDLFRVWDADNSGRIDKFEFRKAVRTLGFGEAQEDVDAVFDSFDTDGGGQVEYAELNRILHQKPTDASLAQRRGMNGLASVSTHAPPPPAGAAHTPGSAGRVGPSPGRMAALMREKIGGVVSGQRLFLGSLLRSRMGRRSKKVPGSSAMAVVTEADSEEAVAQLPVWQQGDESLYTEDALQARAACRTHKEVLAVLQVWWQAAQRSLQSGGDRSASELGKERYVAMMRKIYKTMIEDYDEAEALECALEDWERDRQGRDEMARSHFCDGLFELVGASP